MTIFPLINATCGKKYLSPNSESGRLWTTSTPVLFKAGNSHKMRRKNEPIVSRIATPDCKTLHEVCRFVYQKTKTGWFSLSCSISQVIRSQSFILLFNCSNWCLIKGKFWENNPIWLWHTYYKKYKGDSNILLLP